MKNVVRAILISMVGACLLCCIGMVFGDATAAQRTTKGSGEDVAVGSITLLGITVGHSNLTDVQRKFGPNTVRPTGDAATAANTICYIADRANPIAIVFASNAEMAGPPENIVTDVSILARKAYSDSSSCRSTAISPDAVTTNTGLKLGLRKQDVERILGVPTNPKGSEWNYSWQINRALPSSDKNYQYWLGRREECFDGKAPFFTTVTAIAVRFDGDTVTSLRFRRIDSIC